MFKCLTLILIRFRAYRLELNLLIRRRKMSQRPQDKVTIAISSHSFVCLCLFGSSLYIHPIYLEVSF